MKRLIILIIGLFTIQVLNAQTMTDGEVVYDENFNPIVKICWQSQRASATQDKITTKV